MRLLRYIPGVYSKDAAHTEPRFFEFEYDPDKSTANLAKHGVDFEQAQRLWEDPRAVEVRLPYEEEPRWAVFGMTDGKHWTAVITYRSGGIRLISVRRSRANEEEYYDAQAH